MKFRLNEKGSLFKVITMVGVILIPFFYGINLFYGRDDIKRTYNSSHRFVHNKVLRPEETPFMKKYWDKIVEKNLTGWMSKFIRKEIKLDLGFWVFLRRICDKKYRECGTEIEQSRDLYIKSLSEMQNLNFIFKNFISGKIFNFSHELKGTAVFGDLIEILKKELGIKLDTNKIKESCIFNSIHREYSYDYKTIINSMPFPLVFEYYCDGE